MPPMLLNREDFHGLAGENKFNDHPQSELTFSGSAGSKKRAYMALSQPNDPQMQSRQGSYAGATTTGRRLATIEPSFSGNLASSLYCQDMEMDAFFRFQTRKFQSGIELLTRKHSRDLMMVVDNQATKRLKVKEMELEEVRKRNLELQEQVRQMAAETQVWYNYAKTSEAVVSSLREKFGEFHTNQIACPAIDVEEGYGDSGGCQLTATDKAEKDSATDSQMQRACRVCKEKQVCVLLLPCRHLCVCKGCESRIGTCPICNSTINASIQVLGLWSHSPP